MQLIVQDNTGRSLMSLSDYTLDLQYGDSDSDFQLYVPNTILGKHWRIIADGTPFGGIVDKRCPSHTADGDTILYKGRTVQGVLKSHVVCPSSGASHYTVSGDANTIIGQVISRVGLSDYMFAKSTPSNISISSYRFNRYVDAYTGLRMMLASHDARLKFVCYDEGIEVSAVKRDGYGSADSEKLYFDLEIDDLPINHLIGLGKGEGANRAKSEWFADLSGALSQTQTLFGVLENATTYDLSSEEADTLSGKTKSKLAEYQVASEADLTLPPGASLDVGDRVTMSNAKFGITATAEVIQVVLKAALGVQDVSYKFGVPDYPKDEE